MKKSEIQHHIETQLYDLALNQRGHTQTWTGDYFNSDDRNMVCLRLKIPRVRKLANELRRKLDQTQQPKEIQFQLFEGMWKNSKIFEAKAIALFWLEQQSNEWLAENVAAIVKWVEHVNNWAHSDTYASILARIFEINPVRLKPVYKNWNTHANPWKRRNSMVGLMLYSRLRKRHPPFTFCRQLVHSQIDAPEYYVQKGYGWTLREMYNVYPEATFEYLQRNAAKIAPAAWYAATEKLNAKQKKHLMSIRKS